MVDRERSELQDPQPSVKDRVRQALESPRYKWRTVEGVANELNLDPSLAEQTILETEDLARSSRQTADGKSLYTTRPHFQRTASIWTKLIGAFKLRLD